jgi:hypothetical protein
MPVSAAGIRTEPPVSVPSPAGAAPQAIAAAVPPLLPPANLAGSAGLRTGPYEPFALVAPNASSCMLVLPSTIAPAARSRVIAAASSSGMKLASTSEPAVLGNPAT